MQASLPMQQSPPAQRACRKSLIGKTLMMTPSSSIRLGRGTWQTRMDFFGLCSLAKTRKPFKSDGKIVSEILTSIATYPSFKMKSTSSLSLVRQ